MVKKGRPGRKKQKRPVLLPSDVDLESLLFSLVSDGDPRLSTVMESLKRFDNADNFWTKFQKGGATLMMEAVLSGQVPSLVSLVKVPALANHPSLLANNKGVL